MIKESNIFPIENLSALSADYRLLEIIGLNSTGDDYDINIQYITKKLSYSLRHPVIVIHREGIPFLIVKDEAEILEAIPNDGLEAKYGDFVYFKDTDQVRFLDFESEDDSEKQIILRFLQFDLSGEIRKDPRLWQPRTGDAFYSKEPARNAGSNQVAIFNGFIPRVVALPTGGYGICVDITKKYMAKNPLRAHLSNAEFNNLKRQKRRLVYRYGKNWFEIKPDELSSLDISKYRFKRESGSVTLLDDIRKIYNGTMPPHLAKIPDSASVLVYRNNEKQPKGAVAAMCYATYDTEDREVSRLHRASIIPPFFRRKYSSTVISKYLNKLKHGNVQIQISTTPLSPDLGLFDIPDLQFNNDIILGCETSSKANLRVEKQKLGMERKKLLLSSKVGFYTNAPFTRQYILVPETIHNSFGNEKYFLKDLAAMVDKMHPTSSGWKPIVVPYDDRNKTNSLDIGLEIISKLGENTTMMREGYAVVILPSHLERNKKMHDETAALVVSECLNDYNVSASIMHTRILEKCYGHEEVNGESRYYIKRGENKKLERLYQGYLFGVAVNQVLLNNERWPFILATPLHADLVIGIDVKQHIAGFTFVDKYSKNILPAWDKSQNKEKLSSDQVSRILVENITKFAEFSDQPIKTITFHRDGRIFQTEKAGIESAIKLLVETGTLPPDTSYTVVEIPKKSKVPFRLFDVTKTFDIWKEHEDNGKVLNPRMGTYALLNDYEAYVCTTGREYSKKGTSKPLYVKHISGSMPFKNVLEDIFFLSHLAYTKPDDCSRNPITIKMTDRRINLLGSPYNSQKINLMKSINP